jgi:beta-glucanase (GH16 family)
VVGLRYGRFTIEISRPRVPGVVTAVVLMASEGDEIDIEILGGDPDHWQVYNLQPLGALMLLTCSCKSNVFVPHASDKEPLYGVFGGIHPYDSAGDQPSTPNSVDAIHTYVIDWTAERIVWIVDDKTVRTLFRSKPRDISHVN